MHPSSHPSLRSPPTQPHAHLPPLHLPPLLQAPQRSSACGARSAEDRTDAGRSDLERSTALPGGRNFIALLQAFRSTGGTAPGEILGPLLEEHRLGEAVSLAKLVFTGQIFGFDWRGSLWVPMFQFDPLDLSPSRPVQQVRAALPALWPQWTVAAWFADPNARLDGRRPADAMTHDQTAVRAAAQAMQRRGRVHMLPRPSAAAHEVQVAA
jgi:hypothetical protein